MPFSARGVGKVAGILFVGEFPGADELAAGIPFVGSDGRLLQRMLAAAGLLRADKPPEDWRLDLVRSGLRLFCWQRSDYAFANVLPAPLPENATPTERSAAIVAAREALAALPKPDLVVALGNAALEAFAGKDYSITDARGIVMRCTEIFPHTKLLPTLNPGAVRREYRMFGPVVADFVRARIEAADPAAIVQSRAVSLWIEPTLGDMRAWWGQHGAKAERLAVDIETTGSRLISCIGFAADGTRAICVPFIDWRRPGASWWPSTAEEIEAWEIVRQWLDSPIPKVFHNGAYDVSWLWGLYNLPIRAWRDDTMLAHHVLYPELPKGLEFVGASYCSPPLPWKTWRVGAEKRGA